MKDQPGFHYGIAVLNSHCIHHSLVHAVKEHLTSMLIITITVRLAEVHGHIGLWAYWFFGTSVCGHISSWAHCSMGTLVLGHMGLWAHWSMGTMVLGHIGL